MTRCREPVPRRRSIFEAKRIDPYGTRDVLEALLAPIREPVGQLVADLVVNHAGNGDPAGLGERFEARGDIDAVAKDIVVIGDHVAKIDADAQPNAPLVG
jgi:hypothetical protein